MDKVVAEIEASWGNIEANKRYSEIRSFKKVLEEVKNWKMEKKIELLKEILEMLEVRY